MATGFDDFTTTTCFQNLLKNFSVFDNNNNNNKLFSSKLALLYKLGRTEPPLT